MIGELTLGISPESDLAAASGAADVEAEDRDGQVLLLNCLLARVELATLGNVLATVSAFHREWGHQTTGRQLWLGFAILARTLGFSLDRRRIKVRWVIL